MKKTIKRYQDVNLSEIDSSLRALNLHPVLMRVFLHRQVSNANDFNLVLKQLLPYEKLLNINDAIQLLYDAIKDQKRIVIVGDYDVDGATSTALMVRALNDFGAHDVQYVIPDRFEYGYGLSPDIVALAAEQNPDLLVTVDNGISSFDGVAKAKALGMKVIITDHHLSSDQLPDADAIVNPHQPMDHFESKNLAGVGVAFYVLMALRAKLREERWFETQKMIEPNLANYLDLVALGTIADLVPLDRNNRILVQHGLSRIRAHKSCEGISALLAISKRNQSNVVASDLAFAVGPRLNAAGRLDDMSLGVACLVTDDAVQANNLAVHLDTLNQERKSIEQDMREEAYEIINQYPLDAEQNLPMGLCVMDAHWHQGVIGIVASKLKDRFQRPAIVFAPDGEAALKGSGRSVEGLHLRDILANIDVKHPKMIRKFGGHAMAAGLSISLDNYHQFEKVFNEEVKEQLNGSELQTFLMSDGPLSTDEISRECAECLKYASPWGKGFPEPLFDGEFYLLDQRTVGKNHLKLKLAQGDDEWDAIAFNVDTRLWPNHRCEKVSIAYRLDINEYRGVSKVQLMVEDIEAL